MKRFLCLVLQGLIFLAFAGNARAQKCPGHPLFSNMPNFEVADCKKEEFNKLDFYLADKSANGYTLVPKSGELTEVSFKWTGNWDQRPSNLQIYENYKNAIKKAGGEVLANYYNTAMLGKLKKGSDTYWIQVSTDGSGYYYVSSIKEGGMRQDVVVTAAEIKKGIAEEGKMAFYGIYFDTDKATLKAESEPTLKEMAAFLKANPGMKTFIVGHTDNTGDFQHNLALSKQRAAAVVAELTGKYGISAAQLSADGVGPLSPVASNAKEEGKSRNRRVELVLK